MNDRVECTECGSHDTDRVHTEWMYGGIEEVRICNDCPTQYTNKFRMVERETDEI